MRKRAIGCAFTIRKSDVVRVHYKKKSTGVRVDDKKKSCLLYTSPSPRDA